MGILDSILGTNTTNAQSTAAQGNDQLIGNTENSNYNTLTNAANAASGALNTGATNATGAINQGFGNATGALTNYSGQAQGTLQNGVNSAVNTIQGSNSNYAPYAASGTAANGMLDNALGLNGAAGSTAATNAFQAAPGYQYQVDQATGAAQRAAAASGMNASGNTLSAVAQLGSNLANQGYNTWLSNLQNQGQQGLTAASGISGNNTAAGSAQLTGGTTGANLLDQTGAGLGTLDAAQGTANAGIQSNLGNSLANVQTGLGNSVVNNAWTGTNGIDNTNMGVAQSQDAATNANNGILSKALGGFLSPVTGAASKSVGGLLSSATGGFL